MKTDVKEFTECVIDADGEIVALFKSNEEAKKFAEYLAEREESEDIIVQDTYFDAEVLTVVSY